MKKLVFGMIMVVFILVAAFGVSFINRSDVSASDEAAIEYITIEIESGDTLWSIAKEYYTGSCGDFRDYVDFIKETNSMDHDNIQAGNYLCIPVYDEDFN